MAETPIDVFRKLVDGSSALIFDKIRCNQYKLAELHAARKEIPDELLPGRTIMDLKPEQREILSKLTSDEVSKERNIYTYYVR